MAPEIAIIVPMFNEAGNVGPLVAELVRVFSAVRESWEIVLVDDCSSDDTWRKICAAHQADRRVRGIRHIRNRGQSAAVWTGINESLSAKVCTLDGDLQNDPTELPKMLALLSEADFVCGHRVNRRDSFIRKVSSGIARRARQAALGDDFADTGCALRAFKRSALDGVLPFNGWHRFLPILVAGNGSRCLEVPVNHRPRVAGVSKYGIWNRLWRGVYDLIGVGWYQRRRLNAVPVERTNNQGGMRSEASES